MHGYMWLEEWVLCARPIQSSFVELCVHSHELLLVET